MRSPTSNAVSRSCVTITTVHTPPKRIPPPPAVACLSRAPRPRVTLSAGSTPATTAPIVFSYASGGNLFLMGIHGQTVYFNAPLGVQDREPAHQGKLGQGGHAVRARGVHLRGDEPVVGGGRLLGAGEVVVGDDDRLVEVASCRDRGERRSYATGADQQDAHRLTPR